MDNFELSLIIHSSNLNSIISIYRDSEKVRQEKAIELEEKLKIDTWTEEEFQQYTHYQYHFDWLLMQSLFVSGFSYFENYMRTTAKSIEEIHGGKIKLKDIKGDGYIDTYRKYINLIGNIKAASSDRKEWQTLNEFKAIRNAITHENGVIKKRLNKVIEHDIYYGRSEKLIRIKNVKFLEDFVETSIKYMNSISEEVKKSYGSQQ